MRSDFNSLAGDYARFRTSYSDELFNAILEYARMPAEGRVLDLASGTGLAMLPYVRRGFSVTGVDAAPAMIEQARAFVPRGAAVEFTIGRAEALPFPDGAFDLISCAQAFHWFEPHAAFAECARVLRPGGALAIFWKHAARDDILTVTAEQIIRDWMGDEAATRARDHAVEHELGWPIFWEHVAALGSPPRGRTLVDGRNALWNSRSSGPQTSSSDISVRAKRSARCLASAASSSWTSSSAGCMLADLLTGA
jgi:SAM-dependent methyltransferase